MHKAHSVWAGEERAPVWEWERVRVPSPLQRPTGEKNSRVLPCRCERAFFAAFHLGIEPGKFSHPRPRSFLIFIAVNRGRAELRSGQKIQRQRARGKRERHRCSASPIPAITSSKEPSFRSDADCPATWTHANGLSDISEAKSGPISSSPARSDRARASHNICRCAALIYGLKQSEFK